MRAISVPFILILVATFLGGVSARAQTTPFTLNLSLGSVGPQVILLQQLLNKDPATRIASTGPGSSGNESRYFGILTKAAVIRFQNKYASEVLAPAGLSQGTGRVGTFTRMKLNVLSLPTPPATLSPTYQPVSIATTTVQNTNLKNVDAFLATLNTVATKQGLSSTAIASIKQQVLKDLATTTDLRTLFLKQIGAASKQASKDDSFLGTTLATLGQALDTLFRPEKAHAATSVPFGGALLYAFLCTQSYTWLITLEPLPPSFAELLSYVPYTQAFFSYNIPYTTELLGEYEPGAGSCVAGICPYCITIPNEGMISPMTGSSPL